MLMKVAISFRHLICAIYVIYSTYIAHMADLLALHLTCCLPRLQSAIYHTFYNILRLLRLLLILCIDVSILFGLFLSPWPVSNN